MDEDFIITLNDDAGNEISFEFLDLIEYEGNEYVVLLPLEEADNDDAEVVILQVEEVDDETESYLIVEDEEILQAVYEIFMENFEE